MATSAARTTSPFVGWSDAERWAASYAPFLEANRDGLNNLMKINEMVAADLLELSQEMMRFTQGRFHEDVEATMALVHCRNPSDAFECQCQFAERAMAQYFEEANKLTSLFGRMAGQCLSTMQHTKARAKHTASAKEA